MKKVFALFAVAGLACAANAAVTYNDASGDASGDSAGQLGGTHMDIQSVTVSHDASNVYFDIQLSNLGADWGKYGILLDTRAGGLTSPSNAWGRVVNTSTQVDYWVGSWVDGGGGAQLWTNDGTAWGAGEIANTYGAPGITQSINFGTGVVSYSISRALLNFTTDGTFYFDVLTTGGGTDPGIDHLSVAGDAGGRWGNQSGPAVASTTGTFLAYTIPTPGVLALAGFGGLVAARRRRA